MSHLWLCFLSVACFFDFTLTNCSYFFFFNCHNLFAYMNIILRWCIFEFRGLHFLWYYYYYYYHYYHYHFHFFWNNLFFTKKNYKKKPKKKKKWLYFLHFLSLFPLLLFAFWWLCSSTGIINVDPYPMDWNVQNSENHYP